LGDTFLFQAYLDELVELHRRLMTLRERHILQQVRIFFFFKAQSLPEASRPSLSWGRIVALGGHSSPIWSKWVSCYLQKYLRRILISEATWKYILGALWWFSPFPPILQMMKSEPSQRWHWYAVIPQPTNVMWTEGGDIRNAETFWTRLLVSWENSDKNLSQVL
jgi:hypothetical protein